jgi:hypothetical protein
MAEDLGKEALELLVLLVPAEASANERIEPFKTPGLFVFDPRLRLIANLLRVV